MSVPLPWRFLRQLWNVPPEMSYSEPSGLTLGTTQISVLSTSRLMALSVAYPLVSRCTMRRHISVVRCSRACWLQVKSTSGSFSSVAALSEILISDSARPSYELPALPSFVSDG